MTSPQTHFETRFELKDVLKTIGGSLALYGIFAGILEWTGGGAELFKAWPPYLLFLIEYLLQTLVLFAPLWIFVVAPYQTKWSDFGFKKSAPSDAIKIMASHYGAYLIFSFLIVLISLSLNQEIPGYQAQESYVPLFGNTLVGWSVGFITVGLLAPFLEEWWFRGFLYPTLRKEWGELLGTSLSAGLFALIHFQLQNILPLFILGLLLNRCVKKADSLWPALLLHAFNNILAFSVQIYLTLHPEISPQLELITNFIYNKMMHVI